MFRAMDTASSGTVSESEFARSAAEMRLGISPEEARLFWRSMAAGPGGATYRGFVCSLRDAYDRARAREQQACPPLLYGAKKPTRSSCPGG